MEKTYRDDENYHLTESFPYILKSYLYISSFSRLNMLTMDFANMGVHDH